MTEHFISIEDADIFEFSTEHYDSDTYRIETGDTLAEDDPSGTI